MIKTCPICGLDRDIKDGETACSLCAATSNKYNPKKLVSGRCYGTNSRKIFLDYCGLLGWNNANAGLFGGKNLPLYAEYADETRSRAVWFISQPEFESKDFFNKVTRIIENINVGDGIVMYNQLIRKFLPPNSDKHVVDIICNNGDNIIEITDGYYGINNNKLDRITFAKSGTDYIFLGVYKTEAYKKIRTYKRISLAYPI